MNKNIEKKKEELKEEEAKKDSEKNEDEDDNYWDDEEEKDWPKDDAIEIKDETKIEDKKEETKVELNKEMSKSEEPKTNEIVISPNEGEIEQRVDDYTARRLRGEPIAYISGSWEFYGLPMVVTSDVLIPRIDSEVLVDAAKEKLTGHKMDARVLDLCCGSGCLTCAIAHEMPATRFISVDISPSALEICRKNIALNRLN